MRVGFLTYGMNETMTGIGRYTVELTRALRRLEPSLEIVLLNPYPDSPHPWYREFEVYPLPELRLLPATASLGNWALHRAAVKLDLGLLHDPCGVAPFLTLPPRYRRIVTLHDAIPYIYPETQPRLTRLVFQTLVRAARYTADAVLTVSASAAEDLGRYTGIPAHKFFVTPLGVHPPTSPPPADLTLSRLGIRAPYLLYVGALHPRKNLGRVLAAFDLLRARGSAAQLVIVGPQSWGARDVLNLVTDRARENANVLFTGFLPDAALQALYRGARALVFPSLYEGFGLPALEAMAHGTPVISSATSSLPEVVGDAGLLVDPYLAPAIADAMHRLLQDEVLARRLGECGRIRARQFTWERTAQGTLEVYRKVLAHAA